MQEERLGNERDDANEGTSGFVNADSSESTAYNVEQLRMEEETTNDQRDTTDTGEAENDEWKSHCLCIFHIFLFCIKNHQFSFLFILKW